MTAMIAKTTKAAKIEVSDAMFDHKGHGRGTTAPVGPLLDPFAGPPLGPPLSPPLSPPLGLPLGLPLDVACEQYFHKAMMSFFRAFELRAYHTAGCALVPPALDLGCGDGTFALMLTQVLGQDVRLAGIDMDASAIASALSRGRCGAAPFARLIRGDARALPFPDQAFCTVVCNGSLAAVDGGPGQAIDEIVRVLRPNGSLYCTVPTRLFDQRLWNVLASERLGLPRVAKRCAEAMNRRLPHVTRLDAHEWAELLEHGGLRVHATIGFLPTELATAWSVLASWPLRVLGVLRLPPLRWIGPLAAAAHRAAFRRAYERTPRHVDPHRCAYVLIHAVKTEC